MKMETLLNHSQLIEKCRCCLAPSQEMYNLFEIYDQELKLSDILTDTTHWEVKLDDGLSPYSCKNCANILVDFYNFKNIYQENEAYVRSLLENCHEEITLKIEDKNTSLEETVEKVRESSEEYICLPEEECILVMNNKNKHPPNEHKPSERLQPARYTCSACNDYYFLTKTSYIQHMSDKHQITLSADKINWKKLKINPSISTPLLNITNESVYLSCKQCEEEFETVTELQEHLWTHVPFLCDICGLSFRSKTSFKDHSTIHSATKLFSCPVCHKKFGRKTGMWKHHKLHKNLRQFMCEHCGKRFNEKRTLTLHEKLIHVRDRNFHCDICNVSFPLKSTLQKHTRRRHTLREKTFLCSVCNHPFAEKYSMRRHFKSQHFKSEEEERKDLEDVKKTINE